MNNYLIHDNIESYVLVTWDTGGIFRQAYDLGVFRAISRMSSQSELKYTIEDLFELFMKILVIYMQFFICLYKYLVLNVYKSISRVSIRH